MYFYFTPEKIINFCNLPLKNSKNSIGPPPGEYSYEMQQPNF